MNRTEQAKYWESRLRGGENMAAINNKKDHTLPEIVSILADSQAGMNLRDMSAKYGRSKGGIRVVLLSWRAFRGGKNYVAPSLVKLFKQVDTTGAQTMTASTGLPNGQVRTATTANDPITKLDRAFSSLQEIIVQVIDEEVERRVANVKQEYELELKNTREELNVLKEAAKTSSFVGALRQRWGLKN